MALVSLALVLPLTASSTLESKSPFLPPDHNKKTVVAPKPVQQNGPISREIEFRGVVELNGNYQFSLFNKTDQKGYWIKQGDSKEGISVSSFDLSSMSVTISQNGRSERLTLMESTDSPLPVAVSAPPTKQPTVKNNKQPQLPPGLQNAANTNNRSTKRTIPRRRVILPKK